VPDVTAGDHFERGAAVYESLRTTDEAPVRRIGQLLPDRPVTGLDVGCGTGRYSRLLRGVLPAGSLLAASDVSAAMLAQLKADDHGRALGIAPLRWLGPFAARRVPSRRQGSQDPCRRRTADDSASRARSAIRCELSEGRLRVR
jgi:SAM-dependent methyltransferase